MEIQLKSIKYFENYEQMAQTLNGHFKTGVLEKHPKVMVRIVLEKAYNKIFKNYHKDKISQSILKRFIAEAVRDFRRYYGEWVNIYDFDLRKGIFRTNFEAVYKTDFGRLYGSYPGSVHDHLFYTAHCFEQFRDRGDCFNTFPLLVMAYRRIRNTEPTSADLLKYLVLNANDFCFTDKFIYVNLQNGVLVIEKLSGGIMLAKTFLLPDMDYPKKGWVTTPYGGLILDPTDFEEDLFAKNKKIDKLNFDKIEDDYTGYVKIMTMQINNTGLNV